MARDLLDNFDEAMEQEPQDRYLLNGVVLEGTRTEQTPAEKAQRLHYFRELFRRQGELVKLQHWVDNAKEKVVILLKGRDAAGKGGVIKRITQWLHSMMVPWQC